MTCQLVNKLALPGHLPVIYAAHAVAQGACSDCWPGSANGCKSGVQLRPSIAPRVLLCLLPKEQHQLKATLGKRFKQRMPA